jgi:hypothetical protein
MGHNQIQVFQSLLLRVVVMAFILAAAHTTKHDHQPASIPQYPNKNNRLQAQATANLLIYTKII